MSTAHPSFRHRPRRGVPALILGLVLLAGGATALWLLGSFALDGAWPAQVSAAVRTVGATALSDPTVLAVGIALGIIGLVLLLAGIIPGSPGQAVVRDAGDPASTPGETVIAHRDLARRIRARLSQVDGVSAARVDVTGRSVRAAVSTPVDDRDAVDARARHAARDVLEELSLDPAPRLHLSTRSVR
ncbi:DUF6286 domain-containing protein [Brachybacterium sp. AOP25-B2-12]|uniref:DUF6286 domain-containing protein n=1 Tax=Brachybacterium sp. AOP25-B2-12 TaxID=3457710 RepID=UPI0040338BC2